MPDVPSDHKCSKGAYDHQVLRSGTTHIVSVLLIGALGQIKVLQAGTPVSCDVSLLSPFSSIDNTVGCFNYSPSVGESKPLQRRTLIPLRPLSLQGTHCLLNIISPSSMRTIGLKCGSSAEGVEGVGMGMCVCGGEGGGGWGSWHLGF